MSKFIEMQVDSIRVHMPSGQHVVILKEKDAERFLPIWIGIYEANAIALKITNITPERPITHDLLANILQSADMKLKKIQVTALTNEVFYARLFIGIDGKDVEIDSRPSDAIALAVRLTCPILVAQEVLDKAGVLPEKEEDEEKLTVFKDLVNNMDLPDL
ncbi:MAG TPA: bifunctional nuclease family protein, partial [Candidatus Limnocylindria bacterium]|nr:bifunctional nuclease family protein [Candidatus Limnocylindria bacterium]